MTWMVLFLICCTTLFSCKPKSAQFEDVAVDTTSQNQTLSILQPKMPMILGYRPLRMKKKLGGTWTSRTSPELLKSFDEDSIYYPKQRRFRQKYTSFKYILNNDTLFTFFPHRIDTAIIEFLGPDQLKFKGENGGIWYWLSD